MRRLRWVLAACYLLLALGAGALPLLGGPRQYAPLSVIPEKEPITLTVLAASELGGWITPAVAAFNAGQTRVQGRVVKVQLRTLGSGDLIKQTTAQTDAIIPASSVWLSQLQTGVTVRDSQPVAHSPLVLLTWRDRAPFLFPGDQADWNRIQAALVDASSNSWQKLGGKSEWGTVKFGHANPLDSNSGLALLQLLAAARNGNQPSATSVQDAAFRDWLTGFESGVRRPLQTSSSDMLNQMLTRGPAAFDVVAVPENLAIAAARERSNLQVIYPQPTVWADYPFAVLATNADQQAAARALRDFLHAQPQQAKAIEAGLRLDTTSRLNGVAAPPALPTPAPDVVTALLDLWRTQFNR